MLSSEDKVSVLGPVEDWVPSSGAYSHSFVGHGSESRPCPLAPT